MEQFYDLFQPRRNRFYVISWSGQKDLTNLSEVSWNFYVSAIQVLNCVPSRLFQVKKIVPSQLYRLVLVVNSVLYRPFQVINFVLFQPFQVVSFVFSWPVLVVNSVLSRPFQVINLVQYWRKYFSVTGVSGGKLCSVSVNSGHKFCSIPAVTGCKFPLRLSLYAICDQNLDYIEITWILLSEVLYNAVWEAGPGICCHKLPGDKASCLVTLSTGHLRYRT